jgi:cytochrome c oxidase subunit 1
VSTVGAYLLGVSVLPFIWNVLKSYRFGQPAGADDPWGFGNSLEWATTSPPPRHNFLSLPKIRSERPAFEMHDPHLVERSRADAHSPRGQSTPATAPSEAAAAAIQNDGPGNDRDARDK